MSEPGRTKLLLVEGPAVLGHETMRRLNQANGDRELVEGLEAAQSQGVLAPVPIAVLSTLLSSLYDAAALAIARGGSPEDHKSAVEHIVRGLISQ